MKQRIYSLLFVVVATLFLVFPTQAQSQTDIIDRLDATLGVSLPSEYKANIRGNEKMQRVIKSKSGSEYTEGFIKEQMNSSWGINNQNQLIFVWSAVYKQITDEDLYDGSDGDDNRVDDFAEVVDRWEACGNKYAEGFNKYMEQGSAEAKQRSAEAKQRSAEAKQRSAEAKQRSAEAKQRSAEAKQRSAEAKQRSAEARKEGIRLTNWGLEQLKQFYNIREKAYDNEVAHMKESAKWIVQDCKKYNIDYKKELTPEMLKFYGIE